MPMRPFAVILSTAAVCAACAADPVAPDAVPARSSFDPALIAKGAQLAAIGNCQACHTAEGGRSFAGGRPIETPFGTFYGTNITPDPDTGIGRWSEQAFVRALREGVDRDGRHLYPAFPYEYFTRLTDEDIHALYAYMMTREPVRAQNRRTNRCVPFNIRGLLGAWKALYFERGAFRPDAARSAQWNRGAYLVNGLGHCGACHTPRGVLGAEKQDGASAAAAPRAGTRPALNAGSPVAGALDGRAALQVPAHRPRRRSTRSRPGRWSRSCATWRTRPEDDVRAMAAYLEALAGRPRRSAASSARRRAGARQAPRRARERPRRREVYAGTCAACHDRGRERRLGRRAAARAGEPRMTIPTSEQPAAHRARGHRAARRRTRTRHAGIRGCADRRRR